MEEKTVQLCKTIYRGESTEDCCLVMTDTVPRHSCTFSSMKPLASSYLSFPIEGTGEYSIHQVQKSTEISKPLLQITDITDLLSKAQYPSIPIQ